MQTIVEVMTDLDLQDRDHDDISTSLIGLRMILEHRAPRSTTMIHDIIRGSSAEEFAQNALNSCATTLLQKLAPSKKEKIR